MNTKKIGYVYDERMLLHQAPNQFEIPERIIYINNELKREDI